MRGYLPVPVYMSWAVGLTATSLTGSFIIIILCPCLDGKTLLLGTLLLVEWRIIDHDDPVDRKADVTTAITANKARTK